MISAASENGIHIYDNARRFVKETKKRSDPDADIVGKYVELYWDTGFSSALEVKGLVGESTPSSFGKSDEECPNSSLVLQAPERSELQVQQVEGIIQQLLEVEGYVEIPEFMEAHKLHLPCFTWIVSEELDTASKETTASRIGGHPALFRDEEWPKGRKFLFQINLATLPPRMQAIMGFKGLFQLFWTMDPDAEDGDSEDDGEGGGVDDGSGGNDDGGDADDGCGGTYAVDGGNDAEEVEDAEVDAADADEATGDVDDEDVVEDVVDVSFISSDDEEEHDEDEGYCRVIPEAHFASLHIDESKGPSREDCKEYGSPKPAAITGWVERFDYPGLMNDNVEPKAFRDVCRVLNVYADKFGGYSSNHGLEQQACRRCGQDHLFRQESFHMCCSAMMRIEVGDVGCGQMTYCPSKIDSKANKDAEGKQRYLKVRTFVDDA